MVSRGGRGSWDILIVRVWGFGIIIGKGIAVVMCTLLSLVAGCYCIGLCFRCYPTQVIRCLYFILHRLLFAIVLYCSALDTLLYCATMCLV